MENKAQDDDLVMNMVELALDLPERERRAYLERACDGDSQLFDQAWEYVQWEARMQGFLLDPLYPPPLNEHPFEPGQLLEGRFRILREVAQGGMGVVYEAMDERLERRIAIKCAKTGFRKRLPPEVRNAREVSHPNVCKIFEIHTASTRQGDLDFLSMEFIDGQTLAERLRRGALPESEARLIARQLCEGLAEAHRNQVIHGDLKSNNIILTTNADGSTRAVITDFGLARRRESSQRTMQTGPLGGTPDYMAPELWKGEKASAASDIYALGVILYELVSGGRPPQPQDSAQANFPPPAAHPQWDRTLAGCLEPDPSRRFRTADEVAQKSGLIIFDGAGGDLDEVARRVRKVPGVETAAVFGHTLRVAGTDKAALEKALSVPGEGEEIAWRQVEPKLEDAFIHYLSRAPGKPGTSEGS